MDRKFRSRVFLLTTVFACAFSLLSARLIYLQVVEHGRYSEMAQANHMTRTTLLSERGVVLDRTGELLACNRVVRSAVADRMHLEDLDICSAGLEVAEGLSPRDLRRIYSEVELRGRYLDHVIATMHRPLGMERDELASVLRADDERVYIVLRKEIPDDAAESILELMEEAGIRGVHFPREYRRFYPSPRRATHVIGFVNHENVGQEGIEKTMDRVLTGTNGYRLYERDRRGREIPAYRGETKAPVDGLNVRLTIDMRLQNIVEDVLDEVGSDPEEIYLPQLGARKASVVVMDPHTGEILALASRPHFDLDTKEGSRRNVAVSDLYEPGSTFKIVAVGAALDRKLVNLNTMINCDPRSLGSLGFGLRDYRTFADLSVSDVIKKSSNVGAYKLAMQLGRKSFYESMRSFGFGEPTGVELTAETPGMVKQPEQWSGPSFSRMAMGYEVAVTPLQMAAAVSAVANGGQLMTPRLVMEIEDQAGRPVESFAPEIRRRVLSESAAEQLRKAMMRVTEEGGTATHAAIPGVKVAGKTGTAQRYDTAINNYAPGHYVVSFAGFVPADDPRLACVVVVDDPLCDPALRAGGRVAAPLFRRIAERALGALELLPPSPPLAASSTPSLFPHLPRGQ